MARPTAAYTYDANGNRTMKTASGTTKKYDYAQVMAGDGRGYGVTTYSYDVLGRMTGMAQGDTAASYTYDGAGLRQSKTVDGVTTSFVLDGMYVAAETSGETSTYYSRGVNLISRSTGESKDYYYMNSHGDVTKLVNGSGTVVVDYTYDAFGNQTEEAEDVNPFRYAGEYYDEETGLIYLRARYYDSGVGGFTSADTHWNVGNMIYGDDNTGIPSIAAIMQSGNLYVYCMGNPVNYTDPNGRKIFLSGTQEEIHIIKTYLNKLTNYTLNCNIKTGELYINTSLNKGGNEFDSGNELLEILNESEFDVTISVGKGGNSASTNNWTNASNGTGANASINFDPESNPGILTVDPDTGRVAPASRPHQIGLGHELIHALGIVTGTSVPLSEISEYTYINANGVAVTQARRTEELVTVGLIPGRAISENDLRREQGLNLRGAY